MNNSPSPQMTAPRSVRQWYEANKRRAGAAKAKIPSEDRREKLINGIEDIMRTAGGTSSYEYVAAYLREFLVNFDLTDAALKQCDERIESHHFDNIPTNTAEAIQRITNPYNDAYEKLDKLKAELLDLFYNLSLSELFR